MSFRCDIVLSHIRTWFWRRTAVYIRCAVWCSGNNHVVLERLTPFVHVFVWFNTSIDISDCTISSSSSTTNFGYHALSVATLAFAKPLHACLCSGLTHILRQSSYAIIKLPLPAHSGQWYWHCIFRFFIDFFIYLIAFLRLRNLQQQNKASLPTLWHRRHLAQVYPSLPSYIQTPYVL